MTCGISRNLEITPPPRHVFYVAKPVFLLEFSGIHNNNTHHPSQPHHLSSFRSFDDFQIALSANGLHVVKVNPAPEILSGPSMAGLPSLFLTEKDAEKRSTGNKNLQKNPKYDCDGNS